MPANDSGWAFSGTAAIVTANNDELPIPAEATRSSVPANDGEWAIAETGVANNALFTRPVETTASIANDGEGVFATIITTNDGDSGHNPERATTLAMSNSNWGLPRQPQSYMKIYSPSRC